MANNEALAEINKRIAIIQDNLRQLVEQAAAFSGAEDEERNADRIADQEAKLAALEKQRDALIARRNGDTITLSHGAGGRRARMRAAMERG